MISSFIFGSHIETLQQVLLCCVLFGSVAQLVRFFMVESVHPDLSLRLDIVNNVFLLVVVDMSINNVTSMMISLISRFVGLIQFLEVEYTCTFIR